MTAEFICGCCWYQVYDAAASEAPPDRLCHFCRWIKAQALSPQQEHELREAVRRSKVYEK
jgi:hypothetical protein